MSFKYLGYDLQAMLSFISYFSDKLTLEYDGSEWVINVIDNKIGDQEFMHPSVTRCVLQAFKPYKSASDEQREKFKIAINSMRDSK